MNPRTESTRVNDVHSALNETPVSLIMRPRDTDEAAACVREHGGRGIAVCGARHAMGGQQFLRDSVLFDTRAMKAVRGCDAERGLLRIGAGAVWTDVVRACREMDGRGPHPWAIRQKQTGADELTLGGSIACNAHGRGLLMGPIVEDVESLRLVTPDGEAVECSRAENAPLFALVVGGYGLFGLVTEVTLRLVPRRPMRRLVDIIDIDDAVRAVERRIADGCVYGDFQYAIDPADAGFLRRGVFACYRPDDGATVTSGESDLTRDQWIGLLRLAHTDKRAAFEKYSAHYLASHGRVYWSDDLQLSTYIPSYSEFLTHDSAGAHARESLVITELYVPPDSLGEFLAAARGVLRESGVEDIYGTIRSIRRDDTTFLPWASRDWACIIFNLRTPHTGAGIDRSRGTARALIDAAAGFGGSFFLTYHRWAAREQLLRCYPRLPVFLAKKTEVDPRGVFRSDWYEHLRSILE